MEWWEAEELKAALWISNNPAWPNYKNLKNNRPSKKTIDNDFLRWFPLSGNYPDGVKERAVWRKRKKHTLRKYRKISRL
jgi:hypothetical protein